MITIVRKNLDEVIAKLRAINDEALITDSLLAAGIHLAGKLKDDYPPVGARPSRASVYGGAFKTDRQRRFFFAALRRGDIQVPYVRGSSGGSQNFGKRWNAEIVDPLTVSVGNNATYGRFLMAPLGQSLYMRQLGWQNTDELSRKYEPEIVARVDKQLGELLAKAGL